MNKIKYIKKLILTKNETENLELIFEPGVNVIIGPKGGGKSTILSILFYLHHSVKPPKKMLEALRHFFLSIDRLEYSDGETKTLASLNNSEINIAKNDLIEQNDQLKTNADKNSEILDDKENFVNEIITDNAQIINMLLKEYLSTFTDISKRVRDEVS
jgi:chromosome segregation ATPase